MRIRVGGGGGGGEERNVRFSENLAGFAFLKHLFRIRPFALLPTSLKFYGAFIYLIIA